MNNFRRFVALLLAVFCVASFAACGKDEAAVTTAAPDSGNHEDKETVDEVVTVPDRGENKIKIAAPADSGGLAFSKLAIDRSYAYSVEQKGITSAVAAEKIKNGEAQVAVLNIADAVSLASQADIKIIAVNTNLVLSVLGKGDTVKGYSDLNGKTVYACGEGTYIQWVIEKTLKDNGIKADIVYASVDEINAKMKSGEAEICILPEFDGTYLANANADAGFVKKFPLLSLWKEDFVPAATCVVARTDYIEANPQYMKELISDFEMATNSGIDNEAGTGYLAQILTQNGYFSDFELAKRAVSAVGFVYLDGEEMKAAIEANVEFYAACGAAIAAPADTAYYGS